MKRLISSLLAFIMVLSLIPISGIIASAADFLNISAQLVEGTTKVTLSWNTSKYTSSLYGGYAIFMTDSIAGDTPATTDFSDYSDTYTEANPYSVITSRSQGTVTTENLGVGTKYFMIRVLARGATSWKTNVEPSFCSVEIVAVEKNAINIYRADAEPVLDGQLSENEYYLFADSASSDLTIKSENFDNYAGADGIAKYYASYNDEYLFLAGEITCYDHINSWFFEQNGTDDTHHAIYDGHAMQLGITGCDISDDDYVRALTSSSNYITETNLWATVWNSRLVRQINIALTDDHYVKMYNSAELYPLLNQTWYDINWVNNVRGSNRQLSGVPMSHVAASNGSAYRYVTSEGYTIQYDAAQLGEDRDQYDSPYSTGLFKVSHNGNIGAVLDEEGNLKPYMGSDYLFEYDQTNDGTNKDVYEIKIPWEWIDYMTSKSDNAGDFSTFGLYNVRQQQLNLGLKTVDNSYYAVKEGATNAETVATEKTVDGTYFGLSMSMITGDVVYNETYEPVQATDADGNPVVDSQGNPVYVQKTDESGNPVFDENGDPVYETTTVYETTGRETVDFACSNQSKIKDFGLMYLAGEYTNPGCATGHTEAKEWETVTAATCEGVGSEVLKCTVCGKVLQTRDIPATGHTEAKEWETVTPPTCEEAGSEVLKCTVCHKVLQTRDIPATGHKLITNLTADAEQTSVNLAWDAFDAATCYKIYQKVDTAWTLVGESKTASYTVTGLTAATAYEFAVRASDGSNFVDCDYSTISATTDAASITVTGVTASSLTLRGATLSWNKCAEAAKYLVAKFDNGIWTTVTTTTSLSYAITGLEAGTEYTYGVRALDSTDAVIDADYASVTFSTKANPNYNLTTSTLKYNYAVLKWDAPEDAYRYALGKYEDGKWEFIKWVYSTEAGIAGLTRKTEYTFGIRCQNSSKGYIDTGYQAITFKTPDVVIENFRPYVTQTCEVILKWDAVDIATEYKLFKKVDGAWVTVKGVSDTTAAVQGLEPDTDYTIGIRAKSGSTWLGAIQSIDIHTYPECMSTVTATEVGASHVVLTWDVMPEAEKYQVCIYKDGQWILIKNVFTNSVKLSLLTPETGYHYGIRGVTSEKRKLGSTLSQIDIKTKEAAVTNPKVSNITATSATIKWDAIEGIYKYRIYRYINSEWVLYQDTGNVNSISLTGLTPGTYNKFGIRCMDKNKNYMDGWYTPINFSTLSE